MWVSTIFVHIALLYWYCGFSQTFKGIFLLPDSNNKMNFSVLLPLTHFGPKKKLNWAAQYFIAERYVKCPESIAYKHTYMLPYCCLPQHIPISCFGPLLPGLLLMCTHTVVLCMPFLSYTITSCGMLQGFVVDPSSSQYMPFADKFSNSSLCC